MRRVMGWLASTPLTVVLAAAVAAASIVGTIVGTGDANTAFRTLVREGWYVALAVLLGVNLLIAAVLNTRHTTTSESSGRFGWARRGGPFLVDGIRIGVVLLLAAVIVSGHGVSGEFRVTQADIGNAFELPAIPMVARIAEIRTDDPLSGVELDLVLVDQTEREHLVTFSDAGFAPVVAGGVQWLLVSAHTDYRTATLAVRWRSENSSTFYVKDLRVGERWILAQSDLTVVLQQVIAGGSPSDRERLDSPTAVLQIRGTDASGTEVDLTRPVAVNTGTDAQTVELASGILEILRLDVPSEFTLSYDRSPEQPLIWSGVIVLLLSVLGWLVLHPQPRPDKLSNSHPETPSEDGFS